MLVELYSNGQLFKLLEVSKFDVGAHTEGKEHILMVCRKRVLRGIFISNREEVRGDGSKLPNG
jgi:hypothetical protein